MNRPSVLLLGLCALTAWSCSSDSTTTPTAPQGTTPRIQLSPTSLTFSASAGGAAPAAQTVNISNGGGGTLSGLVVSIGYTAGQPTGWLAGTVGGTTAPATLTVAASTGALTAGTYTATVSITSNVASNSPQAMAVTFTVGPATTPLIQLSPTTLTFSGVAGGAAPASQTVNITNGGIGSLSGLGGSVGYNLGQPTGWLTASLSGTTAPATLTVAAATGALTAGTYTATVSITSSAASNSPQVIAVTFTVSAGAAPLLQLSPTTLTFSGTAGGAAPAAQTVSVTNGGGGSLSGLATSVGYAENQPTGWLAASLSSTTAPGTLTVTANPSALGGGVYTATVSITSSVASNSPQGIAVSFTVSATTTPLLQLSPTTLTFSGTAGGAAPAAQTVSVTNGGGGSLSGLATSVGYAENQPTGWLTASLSSTTAPGTLTVTANPSALGGGIYTATVNVASSAASNSPQGIAVSFTVSAATTPLIELSPTTLTFSGTAGGAAPAAQTVSVTNGGTSSLSGLTNWIFYAENQPTGWLTASLSSTTAPSTLTVTASPSSLGQGIYSATVNVTSSVASNSPQGIAVTFTVAAPPFEDTLTVSASPPNGCIPAMSPNETPRASGTVVTVTEHPAAGSQVAGWLRDATGSANPITVTTPGTRTSPLPLDMFFLRRRSPCL
jgi:uncharacterized membrane protein YtjA (UPF0391 family)